MARLGAAWRAVTRSTVYNEATYGAAVFQQDRARGRNRAPFSSSPSSPMGVVRPCVRTFAMPLIPRPCGPMCNHMHTHSYIRPLLYQSGYAMHAFERIVMRASRERTRSRAAG